MIPVPRPADLPASNHYASNNPTLLKQEYAYLWPLIQIAPSWDAEVGLFAKKAIANQGRYETVAAAIGCPWWFVAIVHYREASGNFNSYLGNGDPLSRVSVHVPAGRGPFATWEDGAIDALHLEGFSHESDWSLGMCCYRFEAYNGWGYRINGIHDFQCHAQHGRVGTFNGAYHGSMQDTTPRNADPYMYSGTQFYEKGLSIEDHSFYPDAIDDEPGCMILLKTLEQQGAVDIS